MIPQLNVGHVDNHLTGMLHRLHCCFLGLKLQLEASRAHSSETSLHQETVSNTRPPSMKANFQCATKLCLDAQAGLFFLAACRKQQQALGMALQH